MHTHTLASNCIIASQQAAHPKYVPWRRPRHLPFDEAPERDLAAGALHARPHVYYVYVVACRYRPHPPGGMTVGAKASVPSVRMRGGRWC